MPFHPPRVKKTKTSRKVIRYAFKTIIARTAKSRAELDARAKGADMRSLAAYPVWAPTGARAARPDAEGP